MLMLRYAFDMLMLRHDSYYTPDTLAAALIDTLLLLRAT